VFRILGEDYGPPDPDSAGETRSERVALAKLDLRAKAKFTYEYDLGDLWSTRSRWRRWSRPRGGCAGLPGRQAGLPAGGLRRAVGLQDLIAAMGDPRAPRPRGHQGVARHRPLGRRSLPA